VPIPFRELDEPLDRNSAAFLRILERDGGFAAALLIVNACAEPLEFVYNTLELPATSLCPPGRLPGYAAARLVRSLFEAARGAPDVLVFLPEEAGSELFTRRIEMGIPAVALHPDGTWNWYGEEPESGSVASALIDRYQTTGTLLATADRAAAGLGLVLS